MKHQDLAKKILALQEADLKLRNQLIQEGQLGEGYHQEMEALHNSNAAELEEIINSIGYPTIDKVGEAASAAAWLVIQHAISQPAFMKKCLRLLAIAHTENKAYAKNLAYLSDRIAVFEGKRQSYGTQFDWDENGVLSPQPFDDLDQVNQRRKSIGLNSLAAQTEIIRRQAEKENESRPADFEKRKAMMEEWRKRVGWIK